MPPIPPFTRDESPAAQRTIDPVTEAPPLTTVGRFDEPVPPALVSSGNPLSTSSTLSASSPLLRRLARVLGVDRAVAFTVLARAWSSLAGIGTLVLIARFLSPAEQGFYYTFYSLVALQIVFELGFSTVILQVASHEAAHLELFADGRVTGPPQAHGRLADVLQKSVRWYTVGSVLMSLTLIPVGIAFFHHADRNTNPHNQVHYVLPWLLVVIASSLTFQIDPLFSFLEGCGYVPEVARTRLRQSLAGTALGWCAFLVHGGLFAPGCFIFGQALAGGAFLASKHGLLRPLLRHKSREFRIDWRREVWPFQWRIAISWLAGYVTSQLFNPILMNSRGPVEAGQMGMSLSVCGTLTSMAVAWMNTKAAPFGRMIARREYGPLDRTFFSALWQSTLAAILGCSAVWIVLFFLAKWGIRSHGVLLSNRLLAPVPLAMLFFGTVGNIVVFAEALYLRAHKQEKFMINSIAGAVYIAPVAYLLGRWQNPHGGAWGMAAAYAVGTLFIGLGYGTYTFLRWRRIWHAA